MKVFKDNMNADIYKEIIYKYLIPFTAAKFKFVCNLHQDNDSKHKAHKCEMVLNNFNINWVKDKINS